MTRRPRAAYFWAQDRWCRKGTILAIMGVAWVLTGYAIASNVALTPEDGRGLFHLSLPLWLRVGIWVGCGGFALASSFVVSPRVRALGYAALMLPAAIRALSYLVGWVLSLAGDWIAEVLTSVAGFVLPVLGLDERVPVAPPALDGFPTGWAQAIVWTGVLLVLLVIAGWPEPPKDPPVVVTEDLP